MWGTGFGSIEMRIIEQPLTKRALRKKCRSKKSRIVKKWAKNPRNYSEGPDLETVYRTPYGFVCHPITARKLREQMASMPAPERFGEQNRTGGKG